MQAFEHVCEHVHVHCVCGGGGKTDISRGIFRPAHMSVMHINMLLINPSECEELMSAHTHAWGYNVLNKKGN